MRYVLALIISTLLLIILTCAVVIFQQGAVIGKLKQELVFTHEDIITLQKQIEQEQKAAAEILVTSSSPSQKIQKVSEIMTSYSQNVDGQISMYFKNLSTSESVSLNGQQKYYMASLYKVILTLYILDEVKNGKATLTDKVPGSSITIEQALEKIVTESNNEYAQALAEQYGWKNIEAAMKPQLGIEFSFGADLSTTVESMGMLFEKIALALNIKDDESDYLLNLLKDQQKVSKLPKYLPKNIYSHNKTGEFESYSHDAGIFYTPRANYILIFMSKSTNPAHTNEMMAQMSKEIYEVFNL